MLKSALAFLATIALSTISTSAVADKRVALVIGNSAYQNVAKLTNPQNDATAMSSLFKRGGFDVVESRFDMKNNEMRRKLRDFADQSRDADIAVVYFAGHGIEIDGTNYLIPTDATLERDVDAFDEAVQLDRVLQAIEPAKQLRLVILDACRDNPFTKTMKRTIGSRSIGRGLAGVEPSRPNTMIAFAAKGGSTASDGDSKNSPFTSALLKYIGTPGLELRKAFGLVRDDVIKDTNNRQEPFVYGSLGGNDVSLVPAVAGNTTTAPTISSNDDQDANVRRAYEIAERLGTKEVWDSFIARYSTGFYVEAAKVQRNKIVSEKAKESKPVGPIATLTPAEEVGQPTPKTDGSVASAEIAKLLQIELRRVGCNMGAVDGNWNAAAQKSLSLFNKNAGTSFDVKVASLESLDAVKGKTSRICPLICDHGYKIENDRCTKITCKAGFEVDDGNNCQRIEVKRPSTPVVKQDERDREKPLLDKSEQKPPAKNLEALYAKCNAYAQSLVSQKSSSNVNVQFDRVEACVKNGGPPSNAVPVAKRNDPAVGAKLPGSATEKPTGDKDAIYAQCRRAVLGNIPLASNPVDDNMVQTSPSTFSRIEACVSNGGKK